MAEQKKQNKTVNEQIADAVVKRGRGRPKGSTDTKPRTPGKRPDRTVQTNPGDNTKYINHSLRLAELPKCDMTNAESVGERIKRYFEIVAEDDMKPSVVGMALALGLDRKTLWSYRVGAVGKSDEVRDVLKKAVAVLDLQMNDYMQNGKINPVSGIFLMKNHFSYSDQQEVVITPKTPLGEETDAARLAEKYGESVVIDGEFTDPQKEE